MPPKKDEKGSEDEDVSVQISFKDLEKSMTVFTGDDTYPIQTFIEEFEDTAQLMKWTKIEKLIYAKRLLDGTAKLFLRALGRVQDYASLKAALKEEFGPKINSAIIHKKLAARKMTSDETYQQYFLVMKELALHGKVEDDALMEYVIDGIRDLETNKIILYGASDIKDFRKKLDIYSEFKKKMSNRPVQQAAAQHSPRKISYVRRCFNCGELGHQSPSCPKGLKCFKCNNYGHKSNECTTNQQNKTLNIQNIGEEFNMQTMNQQEKTPYKKIMINGIEYKTLIDTGSDVNIITKSEFEKIKDSIEDYEVKSTCLAGIAGNKLKTEGTFTAKVQIDQYYTEMKFHLVADHDLPVSMLIGNPILEDFKIQFNPDGVFVEKIMHLTLLVEESDVNPEYDIEETKYAEEVYKMCKDYNPKKKKKNSNVEMRIWLTDEDPVFQSPRRLSLLEEYDYEIKHRPGFRMKHADALSRYPVCLMIGETMARIKKSQDEDEHIKVLKKIFEKEAYKDYILYKDILYKEKNGSRVIVVPKKMQFEIIRRNHERGHFGVKIRDRDEELLRLIEEEEIQIFNEKRQELRERARESIKKIQEENTKNYKRKRKKAKAYDVGDLVAIKKTQFSQGSKLFAKFLGPYEVTAKKRNDRYTVKKVGNGEGPMNTSTSADLMKPWIAPEDEESSGTDE